MVGRTAHSQKPLQPIPRRLPHLLQEYPQQIRRFVPYPVQRPPIQQPMPQNQQRIPKAPVMRLVRADRMVHQRILAVEQDADLPNARFRREPDVWRLREGEVLGGRVLVSGGLHGVGVGVGLDGGVAVFDAVGGGEVRDVGGRGGEEGLGEGEGEEEDGEEGEGDAEEGFGGGEVGGGVAEVLLDCFWESHGAGGEEEEAGAWLMWWFWGW